MARLTRLSATFLLAAGVTMLAAMCGCNGPQDDATVTSDVTIREINPAEFGPSGEVPGVLIGDSSPARYRLTITADPKIARNYLRFRVRVQNIGPETLGWDKEFIAGLSWRIQHGRSGTFAEIEELIAPTELQTAGSDRLSRIDAGESIFKETDLGSLSVFRIIGWAMPADRSPCIPMEQYEPFHLPMTTTTIRVQLRYRSGHLSAFRGGVKDVIDRGFADSNALEINWK